MIPGEYLFDGPDLELNAGREVVKLKVNNTGDRPVQIGAHYHFFEVNKALAFDRARAYGMRPDLPSGTAVRFEPGEVKEVALVPYAGDRVVYGFNALVNGRLDDPYTREKSLERCREQGYCDVEPGDRAGDAPPKKKRK
jgi:urease beta subunit